MTSIAHSSKWFPESGSAPRAPWGLDQVLDCSFKGYERQPLNPCLRVPPTS